MQVALVEKGPLGGTCPHRGCIPSKLLIGYAECTRAARRFGFETTVRVPDPDAILHDTFEFTSKYDSILENALGKNVTLYRSQPVFADSPGPAHLSASKSGIGSKKSALQAESIGQLSGGSDSRFRLSRELEI